MNRAIAIAAAIVGLWFLLLASPRSAAEAVVKFAFAAILLLFSYQRFRAAPTKVAAYSMTDEDGWTRFAVLPAAAPVNWFAAVFGVMLGGSTVGSGVAFLWVMGLLFATIVGLVLLRDPRGRDAARRSSFRMGPGGIEVSGQLLAKDAIGQVRIRNQYGGDREIVYDANRGVPTGTLIGMAHLRKVSAVAYRVEVEAGGRAHLLAAGLDEVTARGLVTEIGKMLTSTPAVA